MVRKEITTRVTSHMQIATWSNNWPCMLRWRWFRYPLGRYGAYIERWFGRYSASKDSWPDIAVETISNWNRYEAHRMLTQKHMRDRVTGRPSNITKAEYPTRHLAFGYTGSYDTGCFRSLSLILLTAKALSTMRSQVMILGNHKMVIWSILLN